MTDSISDPIHADRRPGRPGKDRIHAVIFDLGNVVLGFDHGIVCRRLGHRFGIDPAIVMEKIFASGLESEFDQGRLSPQAFTRRCAHVLGIGLNPDEFEPIWSDIFHVNRPVVELIAKMAPRIKILLLSNTNVWHLEHIRRRYDVLGLFDDLILSFQVGWTKPQKPIYMAALEAAGMSSSPWRCAYVDDIASYARAAEQLGLRAFHYRDAATLGADLGKIGVI